MGRTEVQAKVIGERETREYTFLVDTGATYLALPAVEIEALGIPQEPGKLRLMSATGVVDVDRGWRTDGRGIQRDPGSRLHAPYRV